MDDRFYNAFCPVTQHLVCGYKLRPFSLRHRIALEAISSPLAPGGRGYPEPHHLLMAARICSGVPAQEAVGSHSWGDWLWFLRMVRNRSRFERELEKWKVYMLDTAQHPIASGKQPRDKKDRGIHWALSVVVSLMGIGFTEEEAWSMPESRAMFYFYTRAIKDGADIDITTTTMEHRLPVARELVNQAVAAANARAAAKPK